MRNEAFAIVFGVGSAVSFILAIVSSLRQDWPSFSGMALSAVVLSLWRVQIAIEAQK